MAPKLNIYAAVYTSVLDVSASGEKGKDVTSQVRALIDEETQTVTFPKGSDFNSMFGDPEPFHPKQLKVLYSVGGVDYRPAKFLEAMKHMERVIPEPGATPVDTSPVETPKLEITSATWGTHGNPQDVTPQVKEMVSNNVLAIVKDFNLCTALGDPAIGRAKQLVVTYSLDGQPCGQVTIPEKRREGDIVIGHPAV